MVGEFIRNSWNYNIIKEKGEMQKSRYENNSKIIKITQPENVSITSEH